STAASANRTSRRPARSVEWNTRRWFGSPPFMASASFVSRSSRTRELVRGTPRTEAAEPAGFGQSFLPENLRQQRLLGKQGVCSADYVARGGTTGGFRQLGFCVLRQVIQIRARSCRSKELFRSHETEDGNGRSTSTAEL